MKEGLGATGYGSHTHPLTGRYYLRSAHVHAAMTAPARPQPGTALGPVMRGSAQVAVPRVCHNAVLTCEPDATCSRGEDHPLVRPRRAGQVERRLELLMRLYQCIICATPTYVPCVCCTCREGTLAGSYRPLGYQLVRHEVPTAEHGVHLMLG